MSKRLAMLEGMVAKGSTDPFAWYALAMEYANAGRTDDAASTFTKLRAESPSYVPMYLMCGQMLVKAGRKDEGREWLEAGVVVARVAGNTHALSEIPSALGELDGD
jgi:predicted Zn-dependent protease